MTREEDVGLDSTTAANKKRADMDHRVNVIQSNNTDLAISIHQNSFTQESIKGAQVFYHAKSSQGKQLAEMIQTQLKETIGDGNHRQAKSNDTYYMLRKSECPLVIVECGFLTNVKESKLLQDNEYQEKLAWGIHLAILEFINKGGLESGGQ